MPENSVPPPVDRFPWLQSLAPFLRILAIMEMFILLTFSVNFLFSALSALSPLMAQNGWSDPFSYKEESKPDLLTPEEKERKQLEERFRGIQVLERSMRIQSSAEELQIAFELVIPKDELHAPTLANNLDSILPTLLTETFFGQLRVGRSSLTNGIFRPTQWEVDPDQKTMTIRLTAVFPDVDYPLDVRFTSKGEDTIRPQRDRLVIDMSDSSLVVMQPIPDQAGAEEAILEKRAPQELPSFRVELDSTGTFTRSQASQNNRMDRRSFLLKASSFIGHIPVISRSLFAITKAMPLLLFLGFASRRRKNVDGSEKNPTIDILRNLAIVLLLLHFTIQVGVALTEALENAVWIQTLQTGVMEFAGHLSELFVLELGAGGWRVHMVILGIITPILLTLQWKAAPAPPGKRGTISQVINVALLSVMSLFFLVAVGKIAADVRSSDVCAQAFAQLFSRQTTEPPTPLHALLTCGTPVWAWAILLVSFLLLVICGSLAVLLWAATGQRYSGLAWFGTALLFLSAIYRVYLQFQPPAPLIGRTPVNYVWVFTAIVLGTIFLWSFVFYLFSVYQKLGLSWKPHEYTAGLILFGLLLLAIPARRVFGLAPAREAEFLWLTFQLDDLLVLAWVAGTLFLLREDGKSDLRLTEATRLYGSLALSSLLFSTLARWFYIPITFLLGWAAIRWLLATGHDWGSVDEQFKKISDLRWKLIQYGSLVRGLDESYLKYRRDRFDQLAKGTRKPTELKDDLETWEKEQDTATQDPPGELDKELSMHPLAFGPKPTAWENALHGTLWASLFALPWFLIYIVSFMQGNTYAIEYPLLNFLVDLLTIYGRWAAIGFVLGYFFPYLRGDSGLEKGLWLALAVILPTLPLYFILNTPADRWQAAGLWALQVLIECILLGLLAFDYSTSDRERKGFPILLELHGMRSLSIWAAGLVAAIGTSIATLLSSQAVNLISLTLQTLLPANFSGGP